MKSTVYDVNQDTGERSINWEMTAINDDKNVHLDYMGEYMNRISREIVERKDQFILAALKERLGREPLASDLMRITVSQMSDALDQSVFLDGELFGKITITQYSKDIIMNFEYMQ